MTFFTDKYVQETEGKNAVRLKAIGLVVGAMLVCSGKVGPSVAQVIQPGTQARPLQLTRVVAKLNRGETIGRYTRGALCIQGETLSWRAGGRQDLNTEQFDDVFREEIEKMGFNVAGDPDNLFEPSGRSAEFLVGGTIDKLNLDICYPRGNFGNWDRSKGKASIEVHWQIYSSLERKVVASIKTVGFFEERKSRDDGFHSILMNAFANSIQQMASDARFRSVFVAPAPDLTVARRAPTGLVPLEFAAGSVPHNAIADAVGSTVLILSGTGHGSGFLIGADGLILTNAHITGDATYLKIRWSDGVETLGEVIRADKARDVALIKTDARNRTPFRLRVSPPSVGEDVYAIGAPLEANLQSTVSKGIVSANRVIDGLSYIQSDVNVNPGSSGGPLIDANRNVIGLTVLGLSRAGVPLGVNLFIPIQDAQDFLGLRGKAISATANSPGNPPTPMPSSGVR